MCIEKEKVNTMKKETQQKCVTNVGLKRKRQLKSEHGLSKNVAFHFHGNLNDYQNFVT